MKDLLSENEEYQKPSTAVPNAEHVEQMAFQKLSALCARGEHCQHEMLEKMRRWEMDEQSQAHVMERLVKGKYVDDERYARAFVRDKILYNKWGRRKVEQALRQKHIDATVIGEALGEVDAESYVETLKPMLKQKRKSIKAKSDYELNMKLIKWALGRGFTMDVIRQCMTIDDEDEFLD